MVFLVVAPYFIILLPKTQYTTVDKEPEKLIFYGKNKKVGKISYFFFLLN